MDHASRGIVLMGLAKMEAKMDQNLILTVED